MGGCGKEGEQLAPKQAVEGPDKKLLQAAQEGNLELLQAAIVEGAKVNCRGTNDLTPLLQIFNRATSPLDLVRRQCVSALLEHGAAVDERDADKRTPLIHASRLGDLPTVRLLVEAGSCVKLLDRFHRTALLYAADGHHRDIVAYLAANGDLQTQPYSVKNTPNAKAD